MTYNDKYFESPQFKGAIEKYEEAIRKNDSIYLDVDELTDIAEFYYKNGNIGQTLEAIDYATDLYPGATMPLVFRSRIALIDENNIMLAKKYANMISDKSDLDYFYLIAEIMIVDNKTEDANKFLHDCMNKIDEEDKPDYILDVTTIFTDYNCFDTAKEWLDMSNETNLTDYKELMGRIALGHGNYEESEHIFETLIDEDPYSTQMWNNLASTQFLHNKINDSITSSEFSIAINPNDEEAILNKANGLLYLGDYEKALEYYKRFTKLRPEEDTGYIFQGNTLLNMNRPEDAEKLYRTAEQKAKNNSSNLKEIYLELAFTLSLLGKTEEALIYIDKTKEIPFIDKNDMEVMRGHIYLEHNNVYEAQKCFKEAIQKSDFAPQILLHIAISFLDCRYFNIAYKIFNMIPGFQEKEHNDGYSYMALCCKQLKKENEFLLNLKRACEINPYEAKAVLGHMFPKEINSKDYYNYLYNQS